MYLCIKIFFTDARMMQNISYLNKTLVILKILSHDGFYENIISLKILKLITLLKFKEKRKNNFFQI